MAISPSQILIFALSFLFFCLLYSATALSPDLKKSNPVTEEGVDVHEILPKYNLPRGLFPDAPNSYSLSADGSFVVRLSRSCYVHFDDQLVYYDKLIKGKISSGAVSGVSGIQAKKLFVWLPVTGMDLSPDSNSILFHVGALSESLPADRFQTVPQCMSKIDRPLKSIPLSSSQSSA